MRSVSFFYFLVLLGLTSQKEETYYDYIDGEDARKTNWQDDHQDILSDHKDSNDTSKIDHCECVDEEYDENMETGTLKSLNYPNAHCLTNNCHYTILPAPGKAVLLEIELIDISVNSEILIWEIYDHKGVRYSMYHSSRLGAMNNKFAKYDQYVSAVDAGFRISFFANDNVYNHKGFKMTFERVDPETNQVCGNPHVEVGPDEVVVQENITFNYNSGCVYNLIPIKSDSNEEYKEVVVDITEGDEDFVVVRSYDATGRFTSDFGSDQSRTKLVDGKKVQVLSRAKSSRKTPHQLAKITARLNKKGCECKGEDTIILTENMNKTVIRSPGYDVLYCSKQKCKYNIGGDGHFVKGAKAVFLIETSLKLMPADVLSISSGDKTIFNYQFNGEAYQMSPNVMMLDDSDLEVVYEASSYDWMRSFEINITRMFIPDECQCSKFEEKTYVESGSLSITIPPKCSYIYCHWKISQPSDVVSTHTKVEFSMENPIFGDYVEFQANQRHERYDGLMLKHPRVYGSTISPVYVAFSRPNVTTTHETIFKMSWKFENACVCNNETFSLGTDNTVSIDTPGYPSLYCDGLSCQYSFIAPKYHHLVVDVEDSQTENFHDFLRIYNGNSTKSPMIKELSGNHRNETYQTDKNHLTVTFTSDASVQGIGSRIKVKAVKLPISQIPRESSIFAYFGILFVVLIVFAFGAFVFANRRDFSFAHAYENPEMQPTNDETSPADNVFDDPFA